MTKALIQFTRGKNFNDWCLSYIILFSIVNMSLVPFGFIFWGIGLWFNRDNSTLSDLFSGINNWFFCYYFLLIIGMLWTENMSYGFSKLENKFSFLLFPVLLTFSKINMNKKNIIDLFLGGLFISLLMLYGIAIFNSIYHPQDNNWRYFYDSQFTVFMHRSYYSAYMVMGAMICLYNVLKRQKIDFGILLFILFSIASFQTLSKAGLITYCILFPTIVIYSLIKWKKWKLLLVVSSVSVIGGIGILCTNNPLIKRFEKIPEAIEQIKYENNPSVESNTSRLLMWNTSWLVIQDQFLFGTGTGDYDDVLFRKNQSLGNSGVAKNRFNSHNQFLNTTAQLGVFGLLVLIGLLVFAIRCAWSNTFMNSMIIISGFIVNFLFESFLETQAGIVLFCVLIISLNSKKLNTKSNEI